MTPSRPYIMRALYEWIVDNDCTPYVLVDAAVTDVMVPQQFVKDAQIVLNISPGAVMTDMMKNFLNKLTDEEKAKRLRNYPLGPGKPEDVANACVFLLSDAAI